MTLPVGTTTITVTGKYEDMQGNTAASGTVTFIPSAAPLSDVNDNIIFWPVPIVANLSAGSLSVVLPTTDQWGPDGWTWQVTENIIFGSGSNGNQYTRQYFIDVPSSLGATVDLISLAPASTAPAVTSYLSTAGGTVKGNVTVDKADVILVNGSQIANVFPSGDTSGATDVAAIQALLNLGASTVQLADGKYYVNKPITIPPFSAVVGTYNTSQVAESDTGTVIVPTSTFTSSYTMKAVFVLLNQSDGGYSTTSEEQRIMNLMIDGSSSAASVDGVACYGSVGRVRLEDLLISQVTGIGVHQSVDGSGNQPDAWFGRRVFVRYNGSHGFVLRSADSNWLDCLSTNTNGIGFFINSTSNTHYINCRSEHAIGANGFGYVCVNNGNSSGGVFFLGCSVDQCDEHGFQIGGTQNSVATTEYVPLFITGCHFKRAGANAGSGGGGYAGIYNAGYQAPVVIDGSMIFPGVNDDGTGTNSPQIGLLVDSGAMGSVSGCHIHAATTAISDAAGLNYDNTVSTATGPTGSPTVDMTPGLANFNGVGLALTPAAAPASDPLLITNKNSAERAFGMKVNGDADDRVKWTSDGVLRLGPGNATQDTTLYRSAANVLKTDDSFDVGAGLSVDGVPLVTVQPADAGYVGWAFDAANSGVSGGGLSSLAAAGSIGLVKIPLRQSSVSIAGVEVYMTTAGSGLTSGECFAFLFGSSGTFLAATADQSTAWAGSTGIIDAAFVSGPFAVQDDFVWVGFVYNGTTTPSFVRGSNSSAALANGRLTAAESRFGQIGSGITSNSPGNITPSSIVQKSFALWCALY